jgi:hypothetical protein
VSRPFEARYYGRCIVCDDRIEPGDMLVFEVDDAIHEDCADRGTPEQTVKPACPSCWMVHAGECM